MLPPDVLLDELEVVDVLDEPLVEELLSEEELFDSLLFDSPPLESPPLESLLFDSDLVSLGVSEAEAAAARESLR